ncbi:MAG: hypothetical protein CM1200mP36_09310 [Gammaproteobacteria bacterium]|nr:MAG: hypothetical protein CM1200mP36_09310 [Gammaproteobacteria bacterium]
MLALDIPTGLHADTGLVLGAAVAAELTITFVGLKRGLFLGSALDYRGRLEFSDLAIPVQAYDRVPACIERLAPEIVKKLLLPRTRTAHKGENGSLLLVGGAPGMSGAIRLAAEAAFRAGAGLVRVATHPDSVDSVMAGRAEVMCHGTITPEALEKLLVVSDAVVLGPGLGQSDWAKRASAQVLARSCRLSLMRMV